MTCYQHALVLVHDEQDGSVLINLAAQLATTLQMKITVAHLSEDYRKLNYVSDSLMDDAVADDVLRAKAMLDKLMKSVSIPVKVQEIVTVNRSDNVEKCVKESGVDLLIVGHRNRFMGVLTSQSLEFTNHLNVDVLIRHIQ